MDQFAALKQLRESACHHRTGPPRRRHRPGSLDKDRQTTPVSQD
jgi:hypothetical protein